MKKAIGYLRVLLHVDDIQDEHATDFSRYHVALCDGFLRLQLIEKLLSVLRPMPLELDGNNSRQFAVDTIAGSTTAMMRFIAPIRFSRETRLRQADGERPT